MSSFLNNIKFISDLTSGMPISNNSKIFENDNKMMRTKQINENVEYIYQSDIYCGDCGQDIRKELDSIGRTPDDVDDYSSYDSDEYPKGPFTVSEADYEVFCGKCGEALDNPVIGEYSTVEEDQSLNEDMMSYSINAAGSIIMGDLLNDFDRDDALNILKKLKKDGKITKDGRILSTDIDKAIKEYSKRFF